MNHRTMGLKGLLPHVPFGNMSHLRVLQRMTNPDISSSLKLRLRLWLNLGHKLTDQHYSHRYIILPPRDV